ncbi:sigma factor-like helix-turn-helix DNA-binding protein [Arthrobacter sp. H35-D1]|uniref:sigma factor-like helix-turn-helix DNA-binding protein n=1 Tax=Arthrobacter sp. H35-D1 TaxID=3046202 RepID=UPI0024B9FBF6|nr:sigma factor-like helix-turn-helix DNA-binding protein [Arthrobacter sp. H35-D1]MDJ0313089.1 sigma factor-like helix-turn-helix DNA-binding protein [Arthrobacter sp. H35-D1]
MCDVPKRKWQSVLRPARLLLSLLAAAIVIAGWQIPNTLGLVPMGIGIVLFVVVILLPSVREIELGFPTGVKVLAAVRNRRQELSTEIRGDSGELELCAQLLCDDPVLAASLLESAWAKTTATWRGPITEETRLYILCVLVKLLDSHRKWAQLPAPNNAAPTPVAALASLSPTQRVVVVLHEFADLPLSQIASITGSSLRQTAATLNAAEAAVNRLASGGTGP